MPQFTTCLHLVRRTTSLRVGGRAARRSCLLCLRRGGGGRLAGAGRAAVLSCLVRTIKVRSASECVRRSHCAARHTPTQNALVRRSGRLSSHRYSRHDKLQRVLNAAARVITGTRKFDRGLGQIRPTALAGRSRQGSLQASSESSPVSEWPRASVSVGALHPGLQC